MKLIDADDTIRIIKEYKTVDGEPLTERDKLIIEYVCDHIQYLQPTAYDIDAVVRKLEQCKYLEGPYLCEWEEAYNICIEDAIDIVRRGVKK